MLYKINCVSSKLPIFNSFFSNLSHGPPPTDASLCSHHDYHGLAVLKYMLHTK